MQTLARDNVEEEIVRGWHGAYREQMFQPRRHRGAARSPRRRGRQRYRKVGAITRVPSHLAMMLAATTAASVLQPSTGIMKLSEDIDVLYRIAGNSPVCSGQDVNAPFAAEEQVFRLAPSLIEHS